MRSEKIDGIGSIHGGEYDVISVDGIGKLKGDASAKRIIIDGIFKGKGKLAAEEIEIDGVARVFRNIKSKSVKIDGILKLRRASLYADKIICDGVIVGNREINADEIHIDGICSVSKMYGDKIVLKNNKNKGGRLINANIPIKIEQFFKLYFGRNVSMEYSIVDVIECTDLEAEDIVAKVIQANRVKLKGNCKIGKLICDGKMFIDDTCQISEIVSKKSIINSRKEIEDMANKSLVKILDLYKDGKINADEAEKMISSLGIEAGLNKNKDFNLPWEDDGKLRIMAYIGRRLLKKGDPGLNHIEVEYNGEALNVECYGNLRCEDIGGSASAGGDIACGDVGGSVRAGGSINCKDIRGNVSCGGNIRCKSIEGKVAAGGGVHIEK